jgi:hypothetical protein
MIETLLGGVFGGLLRLAPEAFKVFDRANERKHELALLNAEMEFAKVRGDIAMRQTEASMTIAEMDAMSEAFKEQSTTAQASGKIISGISALVRPAVTYLFVIAYFVVKFAMFEIAMAQGGNWKEVLISLWTKDDMTVLFMIISFWFVGRVYDRVSK